MWRLFKSEHEPRPKSAASSETISLNSNLLEVDDEPSQSKKKKMKKVSNKVRRSIATSITLDSMLSSSMVNLKVGIFGFS